MACRLRQLVMMVCCRAREVGYAWDARMASANTRACKVPARLQQKTGVIPGDVFRVKEKACRPELALSLLRHPGLTQGWVCCERHENE